MLKKVLRKALLKIFEVTTILTDSDTEVEATPDNRPLIKRE